MDSSLVLSHLPHTSAYLQSLNFVRHLDHAPSQEEIVCALNQVANKKRSAREMIEEAVGRAEKTLLDLQRKHISVVNWWDDDYPERLRRIEYPPWNIFYIGKLPLPVSTLAVVGSRRPNSYGVKLLAHFIPHLSVRPMHIVSGLAMGIDGLAHHYACEVGIPNFAVLGTGVDVIYPSCHADLAQKIVESGGGILSEFPPGTPPLHHNFPWRNRIITALSDVVWVVQGTAKSGTKHTAGHASDQSKIVATTPGDVFCDLSEVPNRLILDGASLVLQARDIDILFSSSL